MVVKPSTRSVSVLGISSKGLALIALVLQSSIHILVMHYSRAMPPVNGHRYFPSTAVFLNEVIKLAVCLTMALYDIANNPRTADTSTVTALFVELGKVVFTGDSWKMAIPAMLYTFQNSLGYIAISNLDAATYQVTSQLKILSTALFSVMLLGRSLSGRKWFSLLLLMMGIAVIHLPASVTHSYPLTVKDLRRNIMPRGLQETSDSGEERAAQVFKRSATYEGIQKDLADANPELYPVFGFTLLATGCFISGLASVYFEKVLKEPKSEYGNSVWIRNVQLAFYSIWPALFIGVIFNDGEHIARVGFFAGYNWVVWSAILLQSLGGVLVAFVVKYADNIAKNFATSISILVSFSASVVLFDFEFTSLYLLGTAMVLTATYLYSSVPPANEKAKAPQIRVADTEKEKDGAGYFDLEPAQPAKSSLRSEAISSSRPSTPTIERIPHKMKSPETRKAKREE